MLPGNQFLRYKCDSSYLLCKKNRIFINRFHVLNLKLNIFVGRDSKPFVLSKEFNYYRKLQEDLRVRGVGFDAKANAAMRMSASRATVTKAANSSSEEDSDGDSEISSDDDQKSETPKENAKMKVTKLLSKATDALRSRPTRHGSFSEIDIEIHLQYPFPKKFVNKKLSNDDLEER